MGTHRQQPRTSWRRGAGALAAAGAVATVAALTAAPAFAGTTSVEYFDCDGTPTAVEVHQTAADNAWGTGKVVTGGSGTLIPVSFTQSAYDETYGDYLFAPMGVAKGGGNGNHNQQQVACTQSFQATIGDLLADGPPPAPLPGWAQESDLVTVTFTVTAVRVP